MLIDSDHPAVVAFAERHALGADDRERAVSLYGAVRDQFRYDPYRIDLSPDGMRASRVIGLLPLEWDGRSDSLYHPFDCEGRRHMEYVSERGSFDDMPLERIVSDFARTYPAWEGLAAAGVSFDADVRQETP